MNKNRRGSKIYLGSDLMSSLEADNDEDEDDVEDDNDHYEEDDDDNHKFGNNNEDEEGERKGVGSGQGVKYRASQLRGNLTRTQRNRNPLFYYEIVSVLGVGSMGSVARVKQRSALTGGTARTHIRRYYRQQRRLQHCFELPFGLGGFFQYCLKGFVERQDLNLIGNTHTHTHTPTTSSDAPPACVLQGLCEQPQQDKKKDPHRHHPPQNGIDLHPPHHQNYNQNNVEEPEEEGGGSGGGGINFYAMKSIHLSRVTDPMYVTELKNEIDILKKLDHPHIVKAMETFEWRNQIFIVMELCSGGDLYSRDPYTEPEAARIVTSIVSAISYMHSKNILHRDLKYENILFVNSSPKAEIKLIDFGLSMKFGTGEELTEGVGTIYTMAPEVLKGSYSTQADLWSIGVIAFMLMSSQMPFYGRKRNHIVEQIMKGSYEFKGRRWNRMSMQAKQFIQELLIVDPNERANAEQALSMAWLNRRFTATVRAPLQNELDLAHASILQYSKYAKIKKIALLVCAHKSTTTELGILRKIFQKYDTKSNGQLEYEQFKAALMDDAGYSEEEYRTIFDAVDLDGTGTIRYTEFLAATIEAQGAISEEKLAEAFDRLDADDTGYISADNLRELLGQDFPQDEIQAMIQEAATSRHHHDGKISYSDFLALWQTNHEVRRSEQLEQVRNLRKSNSSTITDSEEEEEEEEEEDHTCDLPLKNNKTSGGDASGGATEARAMFLQTKVASERTRKQKAETKETTITGPSINNNKGTAVVMFDDSVQHIPTPVFSSSSGRNSEDDSECYNINNNNNNNNHGAARSVDENPAAASNNGNHNNHQHHQPHPTTLSVVVAGHVIKEAEV